MEKSKLKTVSFMACIGAMLCLAGCGGGSPESVALKFADKFYAEDFSGAGNFCTKDTAVILVMFGGMAKESPEFQANKGGRFDVAGCKIDGDSAIVTLKCTQKSGKVAILDGDDAISLIKQDGEWKVNIKE